MHKNVVLLTFLGAGLVLLGYGLATGAGYYSLPVQIGILLIVFYPVSIVLDWVFGRS